jgi:asparagine synthase (glutamine-hydrolysing)
VCGIFGIVSTDPSRIDTDAVVSAARALRHRGPDAFGHWTKCGRVALAHNRLAIIDLSPQGNQPFLSSDGRFAIVFNGEIYNYLELRDELKALGHQFRTQSDTEVALAAYAAWGYSSVTRFNGDWALAIYDTREGTLFCSRDRFGVKPLVYAHVGETLVFASEAKALASYYPQLRNPNYNVIANYVRHGTGAQHEETWFDGIKRLAPATNLIWRHGNISHQKYWSYPTVVDEGISDQDAIDHYRKLFSSAVALRMRSDVPVGTTLSSGIDSGAIATLVRRLEPSKAHHTFTATFGADSFYPSEKSVYREDIEIQEAQLVHRLAREINLTPHFVHCDSVNLVDELSTVIYFLESGHSSLATLPLFRTLRKAREYVTVVMEGQGADELLAGYIQNVFPVVVRELLTRGRVAQAWQEFQRFSQTYSTVYAAKLFVRQLNLAWTEQLYYAVNGLGRALGQKLAKSEHLKDYPGGLPRIGDPLNAHLSKAHAGGLANLLHYGDALAMANSVENRAPFMDVHLVEFAFSLPFHLKVRDGLGKYIHRQAMSGVVPDFVMNNPIKFGFNTPLAVHFSTLASPAVQLLLSERTLDRGVLAPDGLRSVIQSQIDGGVPNPTFLFRLLSIELWFRRFIDAPSGQCDQH